MPELSRGQELALRQLSEIADESSGALKFLSEPEFSKTSSCLWVRLSLETKEYRAKGGLAFRDRERFWLHLPPSFPFKKPDIYFDHKRFIGTPHVQWGSYICLYQSSEAEYDPSDGMFGFFNRVQQWMTAAGLGQLDPDDAPLHPPVSYATSTRTIVVKANTPRDLPTDGLWLGRAELKKVRADRLDVVGWTHIDDWGAPDTSRLGAAAFLFSQPLAMEYPKKIYDLIKLVEGAGLEFGLLYRMLRLFSLLADETEPAHFILGAPMRRKAAGEPRRPHLTVWEIGSDPLKTLRAIIRSENEDKAARTDLIKWMTEAEVTWCRVLEDREEILLRRDLNTPVSGLRGKRVLLLGCGALGSAIAESVARAGSSRLHLVDCAVVKPGLLVRQRYADSDIGLPKAIALKAHIEAIGLGSVVTSEVSDLSSRGLSRFNLNDWDIIIDATASASVMHRIEEELKELDAPVPLISLSVSAAAESGSVAVKMPAYRGGFHQVTRQSKLMAFAQDSQHGLVKAFWPERDAATVFQPEPGCSEPTFVGSVVDIDHHAAGLLNTGLQRIRTLAPDQASMDLVAAPWLKIDGRDRPYLSYVFHDHAHHAEQRHGYSVRRSNAAIGGLTSELRRIARVRTNKIETGGLLFGEIDDAHRLIWIDSVSGPPSDSLSSETQFFCGTAGTRDLAAFKARASGKSSRFVGIWHTHPISRGQPSRDDLTAMLQLLHGQELPPRQVVMLIVGFSATDPVESYYLFRRDEFVLISVGPCGGG